MKLPSASSSSSSRHTGRVNINHDHDDHDPEERPQSQRSRRRLAQFDIFHNINTIPIRYYSTPRTMMSSSRISMLNLNDLTSVHQIVDAALQIAQTPLAPVHLPKPPTPSSHQEEQEGKRCFDNNCNDQTLPSSSTTTRMASSGTSTTNVCR
jgi:hypothetical protein